VQLLQEDASLTARELAEHVGLTPTPCWRRVQNLEASGVITKRVALVDPASVNLDVTALVQIRTNNHGAEWLAQFQGAIEQFPEVVEAYDSFYKRLIDAVDLYDVSTVFVMEKMKQTTALPLHYLEIE
jgi:Lrp/AsnC family transcriptional regulator